MSVAGRIRRRVRSALGPAGPAVRVGPAKPVGSTVCATAGKGAVIAKARGEAAKTRRDRRDMLPPYEPERRLYYNITHTSGPIARG